MRLSFLFLLPLLLLSSCSVWDNLFAAKASTEPVTLPTDLAGPDYDPDNGPVPMTDRTVLPEPAPTTSPATAPASYGTIATPEAYGQPADNPADYPAATTTLSTKGIADAPATYGSTTATGYVDALLSGLWINTADSLEIIEFATDHYTSFYDGVLLFREPMVYHATCPGDCSEGQALEISCFTVTGPAGTDCYGILRLTPEVLEMSMLGVSTQTITYRKR